MENLWFLCPNILMKKLPCYVQKHYKNDCPPGYRGDSGLPHPQ